MSGKRPRLRVMLNADAVWQLLNRLHMSQNDLAHLAGVTSGYLSLLMNGKRRPSPDARRRLMETLGITRFDDLFIVVRADET